MPLLAKKNFVKEKSTSSSQPNKKTDQKKFKKPSLTKENIERLLTNDDKLPKKINKPAASQSHLEIKEREQSGTASGKKTHSSKKALTRTASDLSVISMHVSIENISQSQNGSESVSDISFRMNEPKIKQAYLQFIQKLNKSNKKSCITSTPAENKKSKGNGTEDRSLKRLNDSASTNSEKRKKTNKQVQSKKNKTSSDTHGKRKRYNTKNIITEDSFESDLLSQDSELSLSQEVLNRKDVKAAYVKFMETSLGSDDDIMKYKKRAQKRKFILSSSSSEESLDTARQIKKDTSLKRKTNRKPSEKRKASGKKNVINDQENPSNETLTVEERLLRIQESRNVGLYVLCDICDKARYLPHIKDPLDLPGEWYCPMNPDKKHNRCSDPQVMGKDADCLIDNLYNAGSIVWSKMDGYPWWPAMVDDDPDNECYFWLEGNSTVPTWYHVTYFDSNETTRAWLRPSSIKAFRINMNVRYFHCTENKYKLRWQAAFKQACEAVELPLIERLRKYSFLARFICQKTNGVKQKNLEKKGKGKNNKKSKNVLNGGATDLNICSVSINPLMNRRDVGTSATDKDDGSCDDLAVILNDVNLLGSCSSSFDLFD